MRVLFAVSNWHAHWFSMVPLGWALQAAGHEVRVLCTPSQTERLTHSGLLPVPVLDALDMNVRGRLHNYRVAASGSWPFDQLPPHPLTGETLESLDQFDMDGWAKENHDWAIGVTTRSSDAAVEYARDWRPRLVVHDLMSLEGPLVGRALKVPALLHLWGPVGPDDKVPGAPPGASFVPADPSDAFGRHGAGEMGPDVYTHVIDPSPASVQPPLTGERLPIRHVPYVGPGVVPLSLGQPTPGRPRVCVVWGTSVSGVYGPASFAVPRIVDALARTDAEVLVAVGGADRARVSASGALPPGARLLEHTPLQLLLPSCDLVVHHGGAVGTLAALTAGVPQLSLYAGSDQEVISGRVAGSGAALALPNAEADSASIREASERLLTDTTHLSAARRMRTEARDQPTPAELVASLTALAS